MELCSFLDSKPIMPVQAKEGLQLSRRSCETVSTRTMKSLSSFPGLSSVLPRADFLSTDPAQERRSPLGIFLRGLLVTLRRISFDETAHLARQIAQWCGANFDGPSWPVHIWSLNRKVAMEDTLDKRVKAMDE